ncbi:MAG: hypothetical protein R3B47_09105 [Bacteroidia bacterium]
MVINKDVGSAEKWNVLFVDDAEADNCLVFKAAFRRLQGAHSNPERKDWRFWQ